MLTVRCKNCGKEFRVKPSQIKIGEGKYCSRICNYVAHRKGSFVNCEICGKELWRKPRQLKHSKSQKFFCSKSHQTLWRNQIFSGATHPNWKGGENIEYRKILIKSGTKQICRLCSNKDSRVLAVHHIDKNKRNNNLNNLTWVCHNCHFLIHNYGVKL